MLRLRARAYIYCPPATLSNLPYASGSAPMSENSRPHPKNVPGPFYVEDGCCIACGIPEGVAPDLFTFEASHCYVKKQPCTGAEINRMFQAIWSAEVQCIRYRGNDP